MYRVQVYPGNEFANPRMGRVGDGVLVQISAFLFYTTKAEMLDLASQLMVDETSQVLPVAAGATTPTTPTTPST